MKFHATQSETIAPGAAGDVPLLPFLYELPVSQLHSPPDSAGGNASTQSVVLQVPVLLHWQVRVYVYVPETKPQFLDKVLGMYSSL